MSWFYNPMTLYFLMGYAIVIFFCITSIIALLGLIKRVKIEPVYMKRLFVALILEIIAGGFFLFRQGPTTNEIPEISFVMSDKSGESIIYSSEAFPSSEVFPFDKSGEPMELEIRQGEDIVATFSKVGTKKFQNAPRLYHIDPSRTKVYIKTKEESYLGYIENSNGKLGNELLYEDVSERKEDESARVKRHLDVLRDVSKNRVDKDEACRRLYVLFLRVGLEGEEYELFIEMTKKYRQAPDFNKFLELGDIYLSYARYTDKQAGMETQTRVNYTEAFKNILRCLTTEGSTKEGVKMLKQRAQNTLGEFLTFEHSFTQEPIKNYIIENKDALSGHIMNHSRAELAKHYQKITD